LGADTTLTVNKGGTVDIAGAGVLTIGVAAATTKLILMPEAKLSVAIGGDIAGTSARTNVSLGVAASSAPGTGTNKAVGGTSPNWTITTADTLTGGTVVLGKIQFVITASDVVGADATAAAGSLTAGTNTILTLAGKS
jgi:hypothetical protein